MEIETEEVMPRKSKSFDNLGTKFKDIYKNDEVSPCPEKA